MRDQFQESLAAAETDFNDACQSAYEKIKVDSGKNITELAAAFGVRENYLERVATGGHPWTKQLLIKMAAATDQKPSRMLGRESIS